MQKENRQAQAEAAETAKYIWDISKAAPTHPIFKKLGHSKTLNCFHVVRQITSTILICESYKLAAKLHQKTGFCIVVSFFRSNLKSVSEFIQKKYSSSERIICSTKEFKKLDSIGKETGSKVLILKGFRSIHRQLKKAKYGGKDE